MLQRLVQLLRGENLWNIPKAGFPPVCLPSSVEPRRRRCGIIGTWVCLYRSIGGKTAVFTMTRSSSMIFTPSPSSARRVRRWRMSAAVSGDETLLTRWCNSGCSRNGWSGSAGSWNRRTFSWGPFIRAWEGRNGMPSAVSIIRIREQTDCPYYMEKPAGDVCACDLAGFILERGGRKSGFYALRQAGRGRVR